jgi:acetyl-CoA acyltransferase
VPIAHIVDFVRTPFGRFRGRLSRVRTDDLAAIPIRALMDRNPGIDWAHVDDVVYGSTNQAGEDNRNVARMASLLAGFPDSVPGVTVNRLCGSGMQAVAYAAMLIETGNADLVVAGGVESMTRAPLVMPKAEMAHQRGAEIYDSTLGWRMVNPRLAEMGHTDSLGMTAENVAREYGIAREAQDEFAHRSQQRAAAATGWRKGELVPVEVPQARSAPDVVDEDEQPRPDTTLAKLASLPPAFLDGGTVTAGNSSGINDGSAALLLASDAAASRLGLEPMATVTGHATVGVAPRIMGIGPAPATEKLLRRTGTTLADVDVIELNEAFASQSVATLRLLGLPDDAEHVNPNGGAIALGHPTGASGARITGAAARELVRRGATRAIATMCIGTGQGIALMLERV